MKSKPIKLHTSVPKTDILKETKEERLRRIHESNLRTRVVKSKKIYNRKKQKDQDRKKGGLL